MIAAPLMLLAAATAAADAAPSKTSLFFRCQIHAPDDTAMHELNLAYFSQPPAGAYGFNLRDPDALLPAPGQPLIANAWPTGTLITYRDGTSNVPLAALIFQRIWGLAARATVVLDRTAPSDGKPSHFAGECSYTDGDVAERDFLELMK
jgi:hypothetical protein